MKRLLYILTETPQGVLATTTLLMVILMVVGTALVSCVSGVAVLCFELLFIALLSLHLRQGGIWWGTV